MVAQYLNYLLKICHVYCRRTGELSISTMLELAKAQHGELALGRDIPNPGEIQHNSNIIYKFNVYRDIPNPGEIQLEVIAT